MMPLKKRQIVYVLSLKTWGGQDPCAYHYYGTIHWEGDDGCFHHVDSVALPDKHGYCSMRHETKQGAIDGAVRFFSTVAKRGDVLLIGDWTLGGWDDGSSFKVLKGKLKRGK
jgi:hypothetical protein